MFRHMMKQMEKKSCVRFREKTRPPSGHHLEIQVNTSFWLVDLVQHWYLIGWHSTILISDWLTRFTAAPPVYSRVDPGSVLQCMLSLLRMRRWSCTVLTSWQTRESAGGRTGGGCCTRCSTCSGSCTRRWGETETSTSPSSDRTFSPSSVRSMMSVDNTNHYNCFNYLNLDMSWV